MTTANIPGLGTVLINGDGRTLYYLSSEAGGKVTCTDANGCTAVWPDSELSPPVTAATAGPGVQASLLGTTKGPTGDTYATYGGYPLYTFIKDTAPGQAHGQGITSFGGTWGALTPAGVPATGKPTAATTATTAAASGGGY